MNKGLTPIIIIFYLLGILILLIYYFTNLKKTEVFQEKPNFPENSILPEKPESQIPEKPESQIPEKPESQIPLAKDCGNSLDCIILASKACEPARAKITHKVEGLFEIETIITGFLEIKKRENENCLVSIKIEKIDFPENLPSEIFKKFEGKEIECKFKIDEIGDLFERWKAESIRLEDFPIDKCNLSFEF